MMLVRDYLYSPPQELVEELEKAARDESFAPSKPKSLTIEDIRGFALKLGASTERADKALEQWLKTGVLYEPEPGSGRYRLV